MAVETVTPPTPLNIPGVKPVKKTLAGGAVVYYYYDRATGKRIDPATYQPREPEVVRLSRPKEGDTFSAVVAAYYASDEFKKLAPTTRADYRCRIETKLRPVFGDARLVHIERADILKIKDEATGTKRSAYKLVQLLRLILNWAINREGYGITRNVAAAPGFELGTRSPDAWGDAEFAALIAACDAQIAAGKAAGKVRPVWEASDVRDMAIVGRRTALRETDVLNLDFADYAFDPHAGFARLTVTPSKTKRKTGRTAIIPVVDADLAEVLERRRTADGITRVSGRVFPADRGGAYNGLVFSRRFRKLCRAAGLPETLIFRGLRNTRLTEMAVEGCTTAEIVSASAHSYESAQKVLDRYVATKTEMADAAAAKHLARKRG